MSNLDRWKDLASLLGIQPAPPTEPETPPPAPEPAPTPVEALGKPAQPRPAKPPTDWSRLAGDLGLAPEVVAAAAAPPKPKATLVPPPLPPAPSFTAPTRAFTEEQPASRVEPRSGAERILSELFVANTTEFQSIEVRQIELIDDVSTDPIEGDEVGETEERPRKRRRRGGRGRSKRGNREDAPRANPQAPAAKSAEPSPIPELAPWSDESSFLEEIDHIEPVEELSPDDADVPGSGSEEERRPRRRRRRRGRGRGERKSESSQNPESADAPRNESGFAGDRPSRPDRGRPARTRDDHEDDLSHADEHDAIDDGHELDKSHRAVPSWDEAIGIIVAANLEQRAQSPNARQSHRGRGRGRGRGGRKDNSR